MIVTFYSFKGGVGRSMAIAAVGYLLAQRGLKVLVVDFDLEAPGLERYFFEDPDMLATVRSNPGLMDLVLDYKRALTSETEFKRPAFKSWLRYVADAIPQTPSGGSVGLMTSGRRHPHERYAEYALFVRSFDWQDFFQNWRGDRFFEWLRGALTAPPDGYDVVLVDSRTGVTEMGGVCAYQLADAAVLLCAPNYQNLDGTRAVLDDFRSDAVTALRQGRPLELMVVPARIEQEGEPVARREQFFADFERIFGSDGLPKILADAGLDYRRLTIPYERELAIIERLVGDASVRTGPLATESAARASFEVLADAVTLLGPADERWAELRQQAFGRLCGGRAVPESLPIADLSRRGAGFDVFVEHGSADSTEAQRLSEALAARGLTVSMPEAAESGEDLGAAPLRALQYSQAVLFCIGRSAPATTFWNTLRVAQERRKRIVLVLLPGGPPAEMLAQRGLAGFASVDLRGGVEDGAALDSLMASVRDRGNAAEATSAVAARSPYPGVSPFGEDDSALFCGRDQDVTRVLEALAAHDVVLLSGPSCVGKTSLVCAGLLPRCRAGQLPWIADGGDAPPIIVVDCASERAASDLERVKALPGGRPALVVIDNIDTSPQGGSSEFQDRLVREAPTLLERAGPWRILLVWRGVWPRDRREAVLGARSRRGAPHECALEPLSSEGMRQAMEKPAAKRGHLFEPGLVDRVLQDAGTQPGAIAQVQLVLADLWDARQRGWLVNRAYDAKKGVAGRFTDRLAAFLDPMSEENRLAVEAMLRAIVRFDPQLACVPRSQAWETIASIPRVQRVDAVALRDRMVAARLIDVWLAQDGEAVCALAQPAAGTLVDRIARADPEFLLWRQRFDSYVAGYRQAGCPAGYTVPAEVLEEAQGWLKSHRDDLSSDEQAVIESSAGVLRAREAEEHRRERERLETERVIEERDRANAERARAERESARAQALARRIFVFSLAMAALAVATGGLLYTTWSNWRSEQNRLRDERTLLAAERVQEAASRLDKRQTAEALAFAADALRLDGASESARSLALHLLLNGRRPRDVIPISDPVLDLAWDAGSSRLLLATARSLQVSETSGRGAPARPFDAQLSQADWSPDGRHVAMLMDSGTVRVSGAGANQPAGKPLAHDTSIVLMVWRPDSRAIVTASGDGELRLWTLGGEEIARRGAVAGAEATIVAWNPRGDQLAVGQWFAGTGLSRIDVWNPGRTVRRPAAGGAPLLQFGWPVAALGWSADGNHIAALDSNGFAATLDLSSRRGPETFQLAFGEISLAVWHVPSGAFAVRFRSGEVAAWRPGAKPVRIQLRSEPPAGPNVQGLVWSPSGALLAVATDRLVELANPDTGQPVGDALSHGSPVEAVAWSGDGRLLATADAQAAYAWDAGLTRPAGLLLPHADRVTRAAWDPSGTLVATSSWDGGAYVWRTDTGERLKEIMRGGSVRDVSWSRDGGLVAAASSDGRAVVWIRARDARQDLWHPGDGASKPAKPAGVTTVEWSPSADVLATAADDNQVRIWGRTNGTWQIERTLPHSSAVLVTAWSPDGQQLAAGLEDGQVLVWNPSGAGPPLTIRKEGPPVTGLAWSPGPRAGGEQSRRLAVWSDQPLVSVWRVAQALFEGPVQLAAGGVVRALAWSPDGRSLATGSTEGTAQVWSADDWEPLGDPLRHDFEVTSLAWTGDGLRLATGSSDSTARVWDPRSGRALGGALRHPVPVVDVRWSADGERLLTTAWDSAARVWDIPRGRAVAAGDLADLARAVGGLRLRPLDERATGQRRSPKPDAMTLAERAETMARLRNSYRGQPPAAVSTDRLLRWYFEDPYAGTISPLTSVRVPEYVKRLLSACGDSLGEVRTSFPAFWSPSACPPEPGGRDAAGR